MALTDKDFTTIESRSSTLVNADGVQIRTIRTRFHFRRHGPFDVHTPRDGFNAADQNDRIVKIGTQLDILLTAHSNITEFQQIVSTRSDLLGQQTLNTEFSVQDGSRFSVEVPWEDFSAAAVTAKLKTFTDQLDKLMHPLG